MFFNSQNKEMNKISKYQRLAKRRTHHLLSSSPLFHDHDTEPVDPCVACDEQLLSAPRAVCPVAYSCLVFPSICKHVSLATFVSERKATSK